MRLSGYFFNYLSGIIAALLSITLLLFSAGCSDNKDKDDDEGDKTSVPVILGAAVDPDFFPETAYSDTLKKYFNCIVPESHMKWDIIQPAQGSFDFNEADQVVNFAGVNGKKIREHVLLWHYQLPAWIETKTFNELDTLLRDHIYALVGRYKGKIFAWDVANEIITSGESLTGSGVPGLRNNDKPDADKSIWADNSDDDSLIIKAFQYAHTADPDAKLFINDNNSYGSGSDPLMVYWNGLQADILYNYVKSWKEAGIPVHGVGMQLHIDAEYPPDYTMIEDDIIRYGALGLEVHFTEIDVRIKDPVDETKIIKQLSVYQKLAELMAKYPQIVPAFVTWGVTDKYSWIPSYYSGYGSALLFDNNYNPKEAYNSVKNLLGQ